MIKRIAVLSDDIVVNVILAKSVEIAAELTGKVCVESENANIGYVFYQELGLVLPLKEHESWGLNEENTLWIAPVEKPEGDFYWNEEGLEWVEIVQEPELVEES
jgi:hypothetical protein